MPSSPSYEPWLLLHRDRQRRLNQRPASDLGETNDLSAKSFCSLKSNAAISFFMMPAQVLAMDIKQLKYFVAIADFGGFSQASRQLNIAQPALSQQISRLEYEVGAAIFQRSSRGVTLTPKGVTLLRHAKFILRQVDQALVLTRDVDTQVSGKVTVGLPPTTSCQLGMRLIERLRMHYPGIVLNLVEGLSGNLRIMAAAGDLDLAMLFASGAVPNWTSTEVLNEELFLIFPEDQHLFPAEVTSVSIEEVSRVPLILPSAQHGLRRRVDMEFERLNLGCAPIAEVDSLTVLMECLLRGMGATVKPRAAINVHGKLLAPRWRCLSISDVSLSRVNYLYSPPKETVPVTVSIVHNEILNITREEIHSGNWSGVRSLV